MNALLFTDKYNFSFFHFLSHSLLFLLSSRCNKNTPTRGVCWWFPTSQGKQPPLFSSTLLRHTKKPKHPLLSFSFCLPPLGNYCSHFLWCITSASCFLLSWTIHWKRRCIGSLTKNIHLSVSINVEESSNEQKTKHPVKPIKFCQTLNSKHNNTYQTPLISKRTIKKGIIMFFFSHFLWK